MRYSIAAALILGSQVCFSEAGPAGKRSGISGTQLLKRVAEIQTDLAPPQARAVQGSCPGPARHTRRDGSFGTDQVYVTDVPFPREPDTSVAGRNEVGQPQQEQGSGLDRRDLTDGFMQYFGTTNGSSITGHCKSLPYNDRSHGACVAACHWHKKKAASGGSDDKHEAMGGHGDHVRRADGPAPQAQPQPQPQAQAQNATTGATPAPVPQGPTASKPSEGPDEYVDLCGKSIYAYVGPHAPGSPPRFKTLVKVVDMCEGLGHEELRVTLDAFKDLGGNLDEGEVRNVNWKFL